MSVFTDAIKGVGDLIGGQSTISDTTTTTTSQQNKPLTLTPIYIGVGVIALFGILMIIPFGGKSS